jgi:hypothetical protein
MKDPTARATLQSRRLNTVNELIPTLAFEEAGGYLIERE